MGYRIFSINQTGATMIGEERNSVEHPVVDEWEGVWKKNLSFDYYKQSI